MRRPPVIGGGEKDEEPRVVTCVRCPDIGTRALKACAEIAEGKNPLEQRRAGCRGTKTFPQVMGILKTRWDGGLWIDVHSERKKKKRKKESRPYPIAERTGSVSIGIDNQG